MSLWSGIKSLWRRFLDLFRANAHAALDRAEDPVRMVEEYIRQLDRQYAEAKKGVAETMAVSTRLAQKRDEHRQQADEWERKAMAALKRGDEDMAKNALGRKRQYATTASEFAVQYETHEAQVKDLRAALTRLEGKLSEARARRDLVKTKAGRARSQEAFGRAVQGTQSSGSMFERIGAMEEKIDDRLNRADAMAQLESNSLANRFEDLERDTVVEDELAMLKARMNQAPPEG